MNGSTGTGRQAMSLAASATDNWLASLTALDRTGIDHDTAARSVAEAKNELWGDA